MLEDLEGESKELRQIHAEATLKKKIGLQTLFILTVLLDAASIHSFNFWRCSP